MYAGTILDLPELTTYKQIILSTPNGTTNINLETGEASQLISAAIATYHQDKQKKEVLKKRMVQIFRHITAITYDTTFSEMANYLATDQYEISIEDNDIKISPKLIQQKELEERNYTVVLDDAMYNKYLATLALGYDQNIVICEVLNAMYSQNKNLNYFPKLVQKIKRNEMTCHISQEKGEKAILSLKTNVLEEA